MVVDVLRHGYKHKMYWDAAKTMSSDVIWYKAPDGAKAFPGISTFGSEIYDGVHWWNPGAGEDDASKSSWYNSAIPGPFKGQHFCGDPEWWQDGCPTDAPLIPVNSAGLPACCFGRGAYSSAFSKAWDVFK
jgi:hypothetical protein